jgi:putative nucleotidyltransferase-like protein
MIINMTTFAGRKKQYIDQTLESLFQSDGRDLPLNLIVGSSDTSYIERYRKVANVVAWDQEAQWQAREGRPYHNFNLNVIRALEYGDDDYCLCCEDDISFDKHWFSRLMLTIAEIDRKEYVLNLGQRCDQPSGKRYATHADPYLCGSQAIFYPSKLVRNAVTEYLTRNIRGGICDALIGTYAKKYAALYNTTPVLVGHIGEVSCFIPDEKKADPPSQKHDDDIEICRVFLRAGWELKNPWTRYSERVLSRAGLNWKRPAAYLSGCGLARPILGALKGPEPCRWAPRFFVERLRTRAAQDALGDLIKREALPRIASVLRKIGGRGVLLKGTALLVLNGGRGGVPPQRGTGDLDLYIDPPLASVLRVHLLEEGFSGVRGVPRTAPHHLAPVFLRGVAVEIHERIMPSFWGLPERDMLAHTSTVDGLDPLCTLSPEGLLLHAGVHTSAHLFSYGLKTAWDFLWICSRFPGLDWDLLARWVNASRLPRSFWAPVRVLAQELSIPLPPEFLRQAPVDQRQLNLEIIARHRLFSSVEGPFELNPFSKTGVFLLLHDSWIGRVRYLAALSEGAAAEARSSARRHHPSQAFHQMWKRLREAILQWRQYQLAR